MTTQLTHRLLRFGMLLVFGTFMLVAAGCGTDHSPMASTSEATPALSGTDEPLVPAAKKPTGDTTDKGSKGSKTTKKGGPARYSGGS